jgi:parallel beta-helix repeat protein
MLHKTFGIAKLVLGCLLLLCTLAAQSSPAPQRRIGEGEGAADLNGLPQKAPKREFYVAPSGNDSNPGTVTRPWRSISHAGSTVGPGAVVHVAPGDYTGPITTVASGTPAARITYVSDKPWGAKLTSSATGNSATWHNKGDFVDIKGFDITGAGALGIYNYGSYVRIIGNHVHDIPAAGCPNYGGGGIHNGNFQGSDDDVIGNVVHDVGDYGVKDCPRIHGIYQTNLGGHIWNNIVYRNQSWGIHLWHNASHNIISGNTIFNNNWGGILVGDSVKDSATADYVVVTNNIVVDNGHFGVQEYGRTGSHNVYANNLLYGNKQGGFQLLNNSKDVGTITADPQFANYQANGNGDYQLRPGSPGLSAGIPTGAPPEDIKGNRRSEKIDLGAYQHTGISNSSKSR